MAHHHTQGHKIAVTMDGKSIEVVRFADAEPRKEIVDVGDGPFRKEVPEVFYLTGVFTTHTDQLDPVDPQSIMGKRIQVETPVRNTPWTARTEAIVWRCHRYSNKSVDVFWKSTGVIGLKTPDEATSCDVNSQSAEPLFTKTESSQQS